MSDIVSEDKIHFLNTGHSDCIILESQGKFAMIDAAEDNDYPANKPFLNLKGYEDVVVDYLVKNLYSALMHIPTISAGLIPLSTIPELM